MKHFVCSFLCYAFQHVCNNSVQTSSTNGWFLFIYSLLSSFFANSTLVSRFVRNVLHPVLSFYGCFQFYMCLSYLCTSSRTRPLHHLLCISSGYLCNINIRRTRGNLIFSKNNIYPHHHVLNSTKCLCDISALDFA
jgi:hypothetical protein